MMAFTYMMASIPGLFVPYQSTSIDLGSVVYRTSSILVEDPGWYSKKEGGMDINFSNWEEDDNILHVTRVGLAVDKRTPNVLSMNKIRAVQQLPYLTVRDKMGLNNTIVYNFSLSLIEMRPGDKKVELLNLSSDYYANMVESIDRAVKIREGEGILFDCTRYDDGKTPPLNRNYSILYNDPYLSGNLTVRIVNMPHVPDGTPYPVWVQFYFDDSHHGMESIPFDANYTAHEYYLYKNGQYVADAENAVFGGSDIIDVIIDADQIHDNNDFSTLGLNLSTVRVNTASDRTCFPYSYEGYNRTNPIYNYYQYEGIMTLRVWQA
jgi:hypothetical protein